MFATRQEEEVGISGWDEVRIEDDDDDHGLGCRASTRLRAMEAPGTPLSLAY
jgi:hypothetical protein